MRAEWSKLISELEPKATFHPPASAEALQRLETFFSIRLPDDLRSILEQSDGVEGEYELGLVWSSGRIIKDNETFRTYPEFRRLYMPFDPLLFFGDAGNGDQFAFTICAGTVRPDIFVWDHENDSRTWVAPDLSTYLTWWLSGKLTV